MNKILFFRPNVSHEAHHIRVFRSHGGISSRPKYRGSDDFHNF